MKYVFTICFTLIINLGFSQEVIIEYDEPINLLLAVNYEGFDDIYNRLKSISENINETTISIQRIDEIRQGQLVINTENIGRSFEGFKIDPRPSLNIELQRVMFSGNFINSFQRTPIIIKQK